MQNCASLKWIRLLIILAIILAIFSPSSVQAIANNSSAVTESGIRVNLEIAGQIGGNVSTIAISGNRAYLGIGPRIFVIDLANLETTGQLQIIGKSPVLAGVVEKIAIADGYAYVAAGPGGLRILDLSSPDPIEVGAFLPANANRYLFHIGDLVVKENVAYLADTFYGMRIIDITQKNAPFQLSEIANPKSSFENGFTMGLAIVGNYAYLPQARDGGLRIINIGNKSAPYEVSYFEKPSGASNGVVVEGIYAYVSDAEHGLDIIDVSNPEVPEIVGTLSTGWRSQGRMALVNHLLYVSDWRLGMAVVDISIPTAPEKISEPNPGGYTNDLAVYSDHILIACDLIGLCILDSSDQQQPVIDDYLFFENPSSLTGIDHAGNLVYSTSNFNGLRIIQAEDPTNLDEIGIFPPPGSPYERFANCVAVVESFAFMADNRGLQVLDVSNPTSPEKVGELITSENGTENPTDIVVDGNWVYITDAQQGLKIIDISQKTAPVYKGAISIQSQVWGIALSGQYAYIVSDQSGLRIFDISNPASPSEVGGTAAVHSAMGVAVSGNFAYLVDPNSGLMTVDITIPSSPELISTIPLGGARGITINGNLAYIARGREGLTAMDMRLPTSPRKVGEIYTPGTVNDVEVNGNLIYVNDQFGGLLALKQTIQPDYRLFLPAVMH